MYMFGRVSKFYSTTCFTEVKSRNDSERIQERRRRRNERESVKLELDKQPKRERLDLLSGDQDTELEESRMPRFPGRESKTEPAQLKKQLNTLPGGGNRTQPEEHKKHLNNGKQGLPGGENRLEPGEHVRVKRLDRHKWMLIDQVKRLDRHKWMLIDQVQ